MGAYDDLFEAAGAKYGVDSGLLKAVATVESHQNPAAVGPDTKYGNAIGMMQILPKTAKSLGIDPADPAQAVDGAARLLAENLKRYGNTDDAIRAYHGGTDKANWGAKNADYLNKVNSVLGGGDGSDTLRAYAQNVMSRPVGQPMARPVRDTSALLAGSDISSPDYGQNLPDRQAFVDAGIVGGDPASTDDPTVLQPVAPAAPQRAQGRPAPSGGGDEAAPSVDDLSAQWAKENEKMKTGGFVQSTGPADSADPLDALSAQWAKENKTRATPAKAPGSGKPATPAAAPDESGSWLGRLGNRIVQAVPGVKSLSGDGDWKSKAVALASEVGGMANPLNYLTQAPDVLTGGNQGAGFKKGVQQGIEDAGGGIVQTALHAGAMLPAWAGGKQIDQGRQAVDDYLKQSEADYQAATPGSWSAGAGRVVGNVVPFMTGIGAAEAPEAAGQVGGWLSKLGSGADKVVNAPVKLVEKAGSAAEKLAQARNLGPVATTIAKGVAKTGAGAVTGAAVTPLMGVVRDSGTNEGTTYADQKENQAMLGGFIGGAATPAAAVLKSAGRVGNTVKNLFTEGRQIAGPTADELAAAAGNADAAGVSLPEKAGLQAVRDTRKNIAAAQAGDAGADVGYRVPDQSALQSGLHPWETGGGMLGDVGIAPAAEPGTVGGGLFTQPADDIAAAAAAREGRAGKPLKVPKVKANAPPPEAAADAGTVGGGLFTQPADDLAANAARRATRADNPPAIPKVKPAAQPVLDTSGLTDTGQGAIVRDFMRERANAGGGKTAVDSAIYVKDSVPTLAEATGNPAISALEIALDQHADPAFKNQLIARREANQQARVAQYVKAAGDENTLAKLYKARSDMEDAAIPRLMQYADPVTPTRTLNALDALESGPLRKNDFIQSEIPKIRDKLTTTDAQGNVVPETDPALIYQSVRKHINTLLNKQMAQVDPLSAKAQQPEIARELIKIRNAMDNDLESGVPGFKQYLKGWTEASKPINAAEWLQKQIISQSPDKMTLNNIDALMSRIRAGKRAPGVHPAKSITDDQMELLTGIQKDLRRAKNAKAGNPRQSATPQNFGINAVINSIAGPTVGDVVNKSPVGSALGTLGGFATKHPNEGMVRQLGGYLLDPVAGGQAIQPQAAGPVSQAVQGFAPKFAPAAPGVTSTLGRFLNPGGNNN